MTRSSDQEQGAPPSTAWRLPQLKGWLLIVFRTFWAAALVAAVLSTAIGGWISYNNYRQFERPASELGLRPGWTSEEARQARFVPQSQIVAVNGRPVPVTDRQALAKALTGPDGATVRLRVRSPDGAQRDLTLTRSAERLRGKSIDVGISPDAAALVRLVAAATAALLMLAAAVLLIRRRGRDPVAALLSLSMLSIVAGDNWAYGFYARYGVPWAGDFFNGLGYPLLPLVLFLFPDGLLRSRWTGWLVLLNLVWALASYLQLSFRELNNVVLVVLMTTGVLLLAVRYRRLEPGLQRLQIRWALFGFAAGTAFLLIYIMLDTLRARPPSEAVFAWANLAAPVVMSLFLLAFAGGLLVSILRYRLYDADAAISRSAAYAILTLMLAGAFAACAKGVELFFESTFGRDAGVIPGVVGAGMAVVLITPMSSRAQRWAERRFQKRLLRLRSALPEDLNDLRSTITLPQLLQLILSRVGEGVGTERTALLLDEKAAAVRGMEPHFVEEWSAGTELKGAHVVQCRQSDPLFPLRVKLCTQEDSEPLGWLLVGTRPDGSLPGPDERSALEEVAAPIGRAIDVVKARAVLERAWEQRLEAIENKLRSLERSLRPGG